jgi:undecaprenyl-diphosphatase
MWPGTSRSMMTIAGGTMVGLRPAQAAEFSFLLGLPTLGGACIYKLYKDVTGPGPNMFETLSPLPILLGFLVATITAAIAVQWLVAYLTKHGLAVFGWYRLVLTAALLVMALTGLVSV